MAVVKKSRKSKAKSHKFTLRFSDRLEFKLVGDIADYKGLSINQYILQAVKNENLKFESLINP